MAKAAAYDVFISHAFEDKTSFVNELAIELTKSGLKVWYSGFELKLGDSISGSINEALKKSTFGIVLISPVYLQKQWAMNELNALFAQEAGQYRILPILHKITVDEIRYHFPVLADRYMVSSEKGMAFIVNKILQAVGSGNMVNEGTMRRSPGSSAFDETRTKDAVTKSITNSNTVNVNSTHNGVILFIILLLIAAALYYFFEASGGSDAGKESIFPSNTN